MVRAVNVAISPVDSLSIDNSLFRPNTNNATTSDLVLPPWHVNRVPEVSQSKYSGFSGVTGKA